MTMKPATTTIDLAPFCDTWRRNIMQPFGNESFTIATDGKAVR